MVIGYSGPGDQAYLCALHFLHASGWTEAAEDIDSGERMCQEVGFYDMTTHPERGDGVDAIDENTELVVALHLAGMKGQDPWPVPSIMYNKRNAEILPLCKKLRIPLLAIGEQPDPTVNELAAVYMEDEVLTLAGNG